MIYYLTYNDSPSGIFSSQVIDVVKYFNSELKSPTKLVSFISLRGFFDNRKKIKNELPKAIVLPMVPGVKRWKWNIVLLFILSFIFKPTFIIGRSVLATQLAFKLKKAKRVPYVIYDGRGAIYAEWHEYSVITNPKLLEQISSLESEVVLNSDFRISVSTELIKYWQTYYNYNLTNHVVIPCTLNNVFEKFALTDNKVSEARELFGFSPSDIVFIYSGSIAGWQSFDLLCAFLSKQLSFSTNYKILFLSDMDKHIQDLKLQFPCQVYQKKVSQTEVPYFLSLGNYGILVREHTITNKVASPVKFAEYLCCGLAVIISDNLGDYSKFVKENECGILVDNFNYKAFDKSKLHELAIKYFTKNSHFNSYKSLIQNFYK